jgi:hypothetical protein
MIGDCDNYKIKYIIDEFKKELKNINEWLRNESESEITDNTKYEHIKKYMIFTLIISFRHTINKIIDTIDYYYNNNLIELKHIMKLMNNIKCNNNNEKMIYFLTDTILYYYDIIPLHDKEVKHYLKYDTNIIINIHFNILYEEDKIPIEYLTKLYNLIKTYLN